MLLNWYVQLAAARWHSGTRHASRSAGSTETTLSQRRIFPDMFLLYLESNAVELSVKLRRHIHCLGPALYWPMSRVNVVDRNI